MNIILIYRKIVEKSRCGIGLLGRKSQALAAKTSTQIKGVILRIKTLAAKISAQIRSLYNKLEKTGKSGKMRKIDLFLAISLTVLSLGFLIMNLTFKRPYQPKWTELHLSRQWETVFDSETFNELKTEFEELNPQLRIKQAAPEKIPGTGAPDTVFADNANRNYPDIIFMDDSMLSNLIKEKALLPLDSFSQTPDSIEQWATPLILSMDILFYNIDALKSAGFDRPPKTRDEFLKYTRALMEGSGIRGTALGLSPDDSNAIRREILSWYWAAGFSLFTDDGPQLDKKAWTDLIAFLLQINQTGTPPENAFEKTGARRLEEFAQGKLAMVIAPAQAISFLRDQPVEFDFGITTIPGTTAPGKHSLGLSGLYAGISSTCMYPEEARLFFTFLEEKKPALSAKVKAVPGCIQGMLPAVRGYPGDYLTEDPLYAKAWDIFESSDIATTFSGHTLAGEFEKIIREELSHCFSGQTNPAETAAAIEKRWASLQ